LGTRWRYPNFIFGFSNTLTVAGITTVSPVTITGGSYAINGGAYTAAAGMANNGDTVMVKQTSSASYSTLTTATLTIGGVAGAFTVTTLAAPAPSPATSATGRIAPIWNTVSGCRNWTPSPPVTAPAPS
jgi:hypothetical protein